MKVIAGWPGARPPRADTAGAPALKTAFKFSFDDCFLFAKSLDASATRVWVGDRGFVRSGSGLSSSSIGVLEPLAKAREVEEDGVGIVKRGIGWYNSTRL